MFELLLKHESGLSTWYAVGETPVTIGRSPDNLLKLPEPEISRHHCKIELKDDQLIFTDLSTNGTLINGKILKSAALTVDDRLTIGPWTVTIETSAGYEIPKTTAEPISLTKIVSFSSSNKNKFGSLIGRSRSMREIFTLIEKIGPTDAAVCISGESGTGKELVARELHNHSSRRKKGMVAINCAAVPANIIESQLFGHERGAFTGAIERTIGLFEQANEGTLFLDEIGEMPLDLQTRLLRVLETKTVRRIGGREDIPVDFRLICATNRDLKKLVSENRFREDLFFRIFVVPVTLSPLRERSEDIELLANHFLEQTSKDRKKLSFTKTALDKLSNFNWPGNIRELKNTIERSVLFCAENQVDASNLRIESIIKNIDPKALLRANESINIAHAIQECRGNLSRASKKLGIARTTLQKKIQKYGIEIQRTLKTNTH